MLNALITGAERVQPNLSSGLCKAYYRGDFTRPFRRLHREPCGASG